MRLPFILQIILSLYLTSTLALAVSWSRDGCPSKCGNITIPYPFGIGSTCSANSSFQVTCQNSTNPPRLILSSINMEALDINVLGTIRINNPVTPTNCSNVLKTQSLLTSLKGTPFTISEKHNSFVVLGCQNSVWLRANATATVGGCMAICDAKSADTSCNGVNCCQTTIPPQLQELNYTYQSIRVSSNDGSCGYVFPVEKEWFPHEYKTSRGLHYNLSNPYDRKFRSAPLVLQWVTDNSCYSYRRKRSSYPRYYNGYDSVGYDFEYETLCRDYMRMRPHPRTSGTCSCDYGYEGNPYLDGGCTDIDECSNPKLNSCNVTTDGPCVNLNGSYTCQHDEYGYGYGYGHGHGYGYDNKSRIKIPLISVGSGLGALVLLFGTWKSTKAIRRRIKANRKNRFFKRNGGLLLQQQLSSIDNNLEKTKLFSSKELTQATDRFNENRILGHGGQGTVYKGMLTDGRIVAVKKSRRVDEGDLEVFINEVVILSQINHRNVVKLLGCCLETKVPLLVYEFIPNGTLFQHIHDPNEEFPLSWEMRVRIVREVAAALSYLHSAASPPIYHRDIKSTNILLDDKYRAKVADFGTSRSVGIDQTHLTTRVLGTFGYLDPEYFQSSQFTEKSDVYSFGVVMVELLTGEKAISSIRSVEVGRSLSTHFLHSMEENCLFDILDARVLKEGKREEILAIAEVARRCLHLNGKRRPTMKEVVVQLEGMQMLKQGSVFQQNEDVYRSIEVVETYDFSSISGSMHLDSVPVISQEDDSPLLHES